MNRRQKKPLSEELRQAVKEIGGEPLEGSGFENEAPAPEFIDNAPAAPAPAR